MGGPIQEERLRRQLDPSSAQLRDLPLHAGTDVREGQAEFVRTAPANRCSFDGEGIDIVLREDTALQFCSDGNFNGTRDAATPDGEVLKLAFTGHDSAFRCKVAAQSDCDASVLAFVRFLSTNRGCMAGCPLRTASHQRHLRLCYPAGQFPERRTGFSEPPIGLQTFRIPAERIPGLFQQKLNVRP